MKPTQLLQEARRLAERPDPGLTGIWPRAAAFAARRALEETLDVLWRLRAPGLQGVSARAQLACLPTFLRDEVLAGDVTFAFAVLSDACHHHDYVLTPTWAELDASLATVERLVVRVGEIGTA